MGNSLVNVNDMMKSQMIETRNRQIKFSLVKEE